jgi:DNA-binding MarR family transcriptional regulator
VRGDHPVDQAVLERLPVPGDGRAVMIGLTRKGLRVAEAAVRAHSENERRLLGGLSAEQERALSDLLAALARSVAAAAR